jgi:tetratricopeptide (TPR) repeat protein
LDDDKENASIYLEKSKEIDAHNASVNWNDIRLLLKNKKVPKALTVARKAIEQYPEDVEGMGVIGACLRASNKVDESLLYLDRAILLNPHYAEALINRGLIKLTQKDKLGALSDLELAHKLKPHIKHIWDLVLNLYLEFNHFDQAITLLVKIVKSDPNNEKSFAQLALCYQNLGDLDAAIENYKKALKIKPDLFVAHINMGGALQNKGDLEAAIASYQKAVKYRPGSVVAYQNIGTVMLKMGDLEGAIDSYKQVLKIKPNNVEVYISMGHAYQSSKQLDLALASYEKAINLKSNLLAAIGGKGNVLLKKGKYKDGLDQLRLARGFISFNIKNGMSIN